MSGANLAKCQSKDVDLVGPLAPVNTPQDRILDGITWKDWKNLLTHSLIGIGILLVAFYIPVKPFYRILFLVAVVAFNLIRMNHTKRFLIKTEDLA